MSKYQLSTQILDTDFWRSLRHAATTTPKIVIDETVMVNGEKWFTRLGDVPPAPEFDVITTRG